MKITKVTVDHETKNIQLTVVFHPIWVYWIRLKATFNYFFR